MKELLPPMAIMFAALIGCILFYIFEFLRSKKLAGFSIKVWAKDNLLKILVLSPICLIAYVKWIDPLISEQSAFVLGLGISGVLDQIQDMALRPKT